MQRTIKDYFCYINSKVRRRPQKFYGTISNFRGWRRRPLSAQDRLLKTKLRVYYYIIIKWVAFFTAPYKNFTAIKSDVKLSARKCFLRPLSPLFCRWRNEEEEKMKEAWAELIVCHFKSSNAINDFTTFGAKISHV